MIFNSKLLYRSGVSWIEFKKFICHWPTGGRRIAVNCHDMKPKVFCGPKRFFLRKTGREKKDSIFFTHGSFFYIGLPVQLHVFR